ncbi:hypothetical protein UVI_02016750 [Ustilaginoidea virens]|uniref:Uncharacterized protein n=1 Tax=Ustilaginoidea virens TaxID=1159556 RepID=A0A1B5L1M8_USTVR|nr:hypothetical protein UVI_02016750 [Ustilaginoidea virens]
MAGAKSPRVKDDETKKRKREANDGNPNSKRHRHRKSKAVSGDAQTPQKSKGEEQENGKGAQELAEPRPREVIGQPNDGDGGWRISKPMGGRMMDIDPILAADEHTLDTTSCQGSTPARIVATRLSKSNPQLVWVACSDGTVYSANWAQGGAPSPVLQTASRTAKALVVIPAAHAVNKDILLLAESEKASHMQVMAYQPVEGSKPQSKRLLSLEGKQGCGLQILESSEDGKFVVGAFQDQSFVGSLSSAAPQDLEQLHYDFFSFDCPDLVTCLDLRLRHRLSGGKRAHRETDNAVDVIVGGARGGIYVYHNAVATVGKPVNRQSAEKGLLVQKHHWHRKAVHAVKWSRDGHYFISGGSENVLVIWQVDTSKKDFLPHLSGSVENIVVSAAGSSYILHLDDNSAMMLSTAEMKPTAYVAGIQSAAMDVSQPKDLLVRRVWETPKQVRRPIPATMRPSEPSKFYVCVGNGRQATMSGEFSAPMLQCFDLETFTSVSTQALARTQPTDVNLTSKGHAIDEPLVTTLAFAADGRWLASIDEWRPSHRDVENVSADLRDQFIRERREIFLKFWQVRDAGSSFALVSRINAPHATKCPEPVLGLAADPTASSFATIGADGVARVWRPRDRLNAGVAVKDQDGNTAVSWSCAQAIAIGNGTGSDAGTDHTDPTRATEVQGSIAFSEDGSTLFAAIGSAGSGHVFVIDASSGQFVRVLEGLWSGKLHSIQASSSYIIVLSDELKVYDVVGDELRYGIAVPQTEGVSELLQLAVDHTSGHFAVTLPLGGGVSSIGVFSPEHHQPLLVRSTPHRIVSLVCAPDASGFIALDDAAQVWVVTEGSDPSPLATVQPLQDLQLHDISGEVDLAVGGDDAMDAASEDDVSDVDMADDDDEDDSAVNVIAQHRLTDIFDAAPAFAAPSIEDMFYKVTGLLAAKPLVE